MLWEGIAVEQVMKIMKSDGVTRGLVIILCCLLVYSFSWAESRYARVEDLTTLQQTVELGFESIAINDASAEIRDVKLSLQMAKATGSPETDVTRINDQLEHAKSYKKCLVDRGTNCAHLRDVE
jgi:hypothetical protein